MTDPTPTCPDCGTALPTDSPQELCPACLMRQALASRTLVDGGGKSNNAAPPLSPDEIADKFPAFEILECLGRGGMGVVYKARQKSLNRLVAIKILAPERETDSRFAERFAREAELLAQLNHPHIVTIHDFGETGGLYYLVMEFVDGVNLRDLLRDGKIEPKQALAIVPPICEALQFAHDKGIVHRDIKPENLLLDRDGRVKIADFGIASLVGTSGESAGTPAYMAPEQSGSEIDHRADIYALGVVLYEMLTGERPDMDVVAASKKVQIDVRLDEIVLRALEKNPELRFQEARIFKTQVETIASGGTNVLLPQTGVAVGGLSSIPEPTRPPDQEAKSTGLGKWALGLLLVSVLAGMTLWDSTHEQFLIVFVGVVTLLACILGIKGWRTGLGKFAAVASGLWLIGWLVVTIAFFSRPGSLHQSTKQSLAAAAGDESADWYLWAETFKDGDMRWAQGDLPGALESYRKSQRAAEKDAARKPENENHRRNLADSQLKIGDVLTAQGDFPGALKHYRSSVNMREEYLRKQPEDSEQQEKLVWSRVKLGDVLRAQGDMNAALEVYRGGPDGEAFSQRVFTALPGDYSPTEPFDPAELKRLAANPTDRNDFRRMMWLINRAGAEKDASFRYLLDQKELRKNIEVDLALAGYDYSVNGNQNALDYLLAKLAKESVGSDSSVVVALSFIDEWDRSTKAVNSHFTATDGAGGMAQRGFWARRQYLFPRAYLEYKGKAGEGAPLPPEEKDGTSPAAVQTPAADLAAEGMEEALLPGGRSPDGRYEVRVRGSVEAPYGYEILVYAAGGKQPIHTLADVGGILRYSTAREECKALWHPSSKFVVFTDQPTKHSRVLHILAVSGDRVERLKAPDYAMNAIGRADAVENYRRSVPTPQRWEGDDLHLNFRFDTRDGEFSSEVVLHLRHGGNAAPVIELKSVSPAKPADP